MHFALFALSGISDALAHRPLVALPLLFAAGGLVGSTPRILPMILITVRGVCGPAGCGTPGRRVIGLTLTYVLGLALFYALMGLIAGLTGSLFGTIASNPWVLLAVANLLLLCGLAMLDVFPVAAPQRLVAWASGLSGGSYPAVLLLGATSGIVAAPCGAPAFAAVLTWVATTRGGLLGFIYLFVFSLGLAAFLAVVGVFYGTLTSLCKPGPWMVWIKRSAGVVLLLTAEYYFVRVGRVL